MLARTPATAVPRGGAVRSRKVCASAVHPPAAAPSSPQQPPAAASSSSKGSLDGWIELSTKKSLASGNGVPKPSNVCRPEDLVLPPGELSAVDRTGKGLPSDVFRCFGCKEVACQGPTGCAKNQWRFDSDGYLRAVLTARVYDVAIQTPLEVAKKMSGASGNTIMLKREDLQPVFSFKLRGAYNKMASLPKSDLERGVITASAGNHAQGVALAAGRLGCKAIICMPVSTPDIKVANVRRLGGIVELVGESYQETQVWR
ncbi:hypothetical protein FOA52_008386 [Chlamydomonas sp. UWO 241]|nr:hypothetical protein FOA52_008386 [Chlamydomonas sp. UWO 241]